MNRPIVRIPLNKSGAGAKVGAEVQWEVVDDEISATQKAEAAGGVKKAGDDAAGRVESLGVKLIPIRQQLDSLSNAPDIAGLDYIVTQLREVEVAIIRWVQKNRSK